MTDRPRVSVILPVYDGEAFVHEAIASILTQTYDDLELLVIDDGSRDRTPEIVASFDDARLRNVRFPHNRGYVSALNHGLELARGELIARQDADDRSAPERLERQVQTLEADERLVLLGTGWRMLDLAGTVRSTRLPPCRDLEIRWTLLFENAFAHSSVLFRKATLDRHALRYEPEWVPAEDYRLWSQLSSLGRLGNLAAPLVDLRCHPAQVSQVESVEQRSKAHAQAALNQQNLGFPPTSEELEVLCRYALRRRPGLDGERMRLLRRAAELLSALCAKQQAAPAEEWRLKRHWTCHVLAMTRLSKIPELWRSGLARDLLRLSPIGMLVAALREPVRRLSRRLR